MLEKTLITGLLLRTYVVVRIIVILGKYDQRRLWKLIYIVNYFNKNNSQKSNVSMDNKNLKWGRNLVFFQ